MRGMQILLCGGISFKKGAVEMSFSDLKQKDVINICDGRKMGRPIDLILNEHACVEALILPGGSAGVFGLLRPEREGCVIPWRLVREIGDDVILVEMDSNGG